MEKQVSVFKMNLGPDAAKLTTLDEAEAFLREKDVALFRPLNKEFLEQLVAGSKSAISAKQIQSVHKDLSAIVNKELLFRAMQDSPLAEYIPDVMHVGARDFIVNVFNSCVNDCLSLMLMELGDQKESLLSEYREDMKKRLVWPNNRRATPMSNLKRSGKILLKRPKVALTSPDGARGICASVLQQFSSIPSTKIILKLTECRYTNAGFSFTFQVFREHSVKAVTDSVSPCMLRRVGDSDLVQAIYSDQVYKEHTHTAHMLISCNLANPTSSRFTSEYSMENLLQVEMNQHLTQPDLHAMWF